MFLSQEKIVRRSDFTINLFLPEKEDYPLLIQGKLNWSSLNSGKSYKYKNGMSFSPYQKTKGLNSEELLKKLKSLEAQYSNNNYA